jgi:hypothetical protein
MRILCQRNGGSFVGLQDPARSGTRFRIGDNDATPAPGGNPVVQALASGPAP